MPLSSHVIRSLTRRPAMTATVVITIAMSLCAAGLLTRLLDALLVRPPALVHAPQELTRLYFSASENGRLSQFGSLPWFEAVQISLAEVALVAAHAYERVSLRMGEVGRDASVEFVSSNYFEVLGAVPTVGTDWRSTRGDFGLPAVISEDLGREVFGHAENAIGAPVFLEGTAFSVVGVAPRGFGGVEGAQFDAWVPLDTAPVLLGSADFLTSGRFWLQMFARPTAAAQPVIAEQATAALRSAALDPYPASIQVSTGPLRADDGPRGVRTTEARFLKWGSAAGVVLLLFTAANAANLLLLRWLQSAADVSTYRALGAESIRVVRFVIAEAGLMTWLALVLALMCIHPLSATVQSVVAPVMKLQLAGSDTRVLMLVAVMAVVVWLCVSTPAALLVLQRMRHSTNPNVRPFSRVTQGLVAFQYGILVLMLIGVGLFGRSLKNVASVDVGIETRPLIYASVRLPPGLSKSDSVAAYLDVAAAVNSLDNVGGSSIAMGLPLKEVWAVAVAIDREARGRPGGAIALGHEVDSNFFAVTGLRVVRGREFEAHEHQGRVNVAIVNQTLARDLWRTTDPVGECIWLGSDSDCTRVVGVAADTPRARITAAREHEVYVPLDPIGGFSSQRTLGLAIRAAPGVDPASLIPPVLSAAKSASPLAIGASATTVDAILDPQLSPLRAATAMLSIFGIIATLLAAIGLYGMVAFAVSSERRELATKIALGATLWQAVRTPIGRGIAAGFWGVGGGLLCGAMVAPAANSIIFGLEARDPGVFAGAAVVGLSVAGLASVSPIFSVRSVELNLLWRHR